MEATIKKTAPQKHPSVLGQAKTAPKEASVSISEFAVIATGGKQYVVSAGTKVKIEILEGGLKEGDAITFDKVLIVDNGSETTIGNPYIAGATVTGTLEKIGRNQKVETIKYKQKSRYFIRRGHRQHYFLVRIKSIK